MLLALTVSICLIVGVGILASWYFNHNSPISISVIISAIVTFFGLLYLTSPEQEVWLLTDKSMRTAIAGAIVIEYLTLIGIVAFITNEPEKISPVSKKLLTSFTAIVAVVIAFYFSSTTYKEIKEAEFKISTTSSAL